MWLAFRALAQLMITWWNKDRIRVPRAQGKLLRVFAGDRLIIRNTLLTVHARRESIRGEATQVTLTLSEVGSTCEELWYLTYTNRSRELRYSLEAAETSVATVATQDQCITGERIVVKCCGESLELLPEEVCVLQHR